MRQPCCGIDSSLVMLSSNHKTKTFMYGYKIGQEIYVVNVKKMVVKLTSAQACEGVWI